MGRTLRESISHFSTGDGMTGNVSEVVEGTTGAQGWLPGVTGIFTSPFTKGIQLWRSEEQKDEKIYVHEKEKVYFMRPQLTITED